MVRGSSSLPGRTRKPPQTRGFHAFRTADCNRIPTARAGTVTSGPTGDDLRRHPRPGGRVRRSVNRWMRPLAGSRIAVTPIGGRPLGTSDLLLRRLAQYPVEDRANEGQQQDDDDPPRLRLARERATDYVDQADGPDDDKRQEDEHPDEGRCGERRHRGPRRLLVAVRRLRTSLSQAPASLARNRARWRPGHRPSSGGARSGPA